MADTSQFSEFAMGVSRRPPRGATHTSATPSPLAADLKAVIARYRQRFAAKFGEAPHDPSPADGAAVKRLLALHGRDKVLARLDAFMALDDDFIRDGVGWTLTGLAHKWNWLTGKVMLPTRAPAPIACAHTPRCQTPTQHSRLVIAEMKRSAHG